MKKIYALFLGALFMQYVCEGQTAASYIFSTSSTTYTGLTGGTSVSILSDDINSGVINIGFTFNYCGNNYTQLRACSNGWITFNTASTSTTFSNTQTGMVVPMLMPLWDDLSGSSASASYTLTGTAPNRVFTMEWSGFRWNFGSSLNAVSFQVKLFEGSNVIWYIYKPGTVTPSSPSATIGIGGLATSDYKVLNNSSASPTPSSTTFTTNITTSPASGQVYIWTPVRPPIITGTTTYCSGSTITLTASSFAPSPTYNWTGPGGFTATGAIITRTGATTAMSGTYSCTVTSGSTTSSPSSVTVTVNQTPTITAVTGTNPACIGRTLQLTVSTVSTTPAVTSYSWTGPGGFTSTIQNPSITPVTAPNAGTYNVTTSSLGCTASGSVNITVNPTPVISSVASTNPTTCTSNNGSFTLQGLNPSITYVLNYTKNGVAVGPLSVATDAIGNLTVSGLSAATYIATVTLNGCVSNATAPIAILNPSAPPAPTINSNSPVCFGATINFSGTATASYPWTWSGPSGFSYTNTGVNSNPSKSSAVFADSGTYYAYITDASGCTSPVSSVNVVVKPTPNTPTLTTNNAALPTGLCQGQTLNLAVTTATPPGTAATITYAWTDPNGSITYPTASSISVPAVPANLAGTWTVRSVLNGCVSQPSLNIYTYIKWTPGKPVVGSNSPICAGAGYNKNYLILSVSDTSSGVSYTWSGPAAITPNPNTKNLDTIVNPAVSASGTYTVFATLNGCNSPSSSTAVTVNATPAAPTVSPKMTAYCQYDPSIALTATGSNLLWHTASTGGAGSSVAPIPNTSIAGLFIWYVTQSTNYTGVTCESLPTTDSVLVKTKPTAPYTAPTLTYCQGDLAPQLTAIGANLLWYTSSTGGVGSPVPPIPSTSASGTFAYYVTQTVNGCESDRFAIVVTVKPKPGKPGVNNKEYCQNDFALPLIASGSNLLWYTSSSGGLGTAVAPTPSTSYADTQYYYVTQTVNGCESDRSQVRIIVNYTPNALIVASQPYVCQYDSMYFTYFGNALPNASYNWTMPAGGTLLSGNNQGPIWIKFDSAGKRIVSLQVTNKTCKSPITTYIVDVRQAPSVPVNVKSEVCQGQLLDVSLGYANEQIDKFDWNFDGADVVYGSEGGGPFGIRYNTSGQHIISLIAYSRSCPSIPLYDTVNVRPLPDAHIGDVSNGSICAGDSVVFTAERYNPGYLYQWEPANYFSNRTNLGQVYGFIERSGYISLTVTTEHGCAATDSVLVSAQPCCEMYFPNAFTPNGDGKNDIFRPITKGNQVIKTFRVVNRWGQVMFETANPKVGWDGNLNGSPQDMGTYYYYIKYVCANGRTYEQKGEILLIK